MKPGDEGGIEPSTCLRWRRRARRQHPNAKAATARRARGTPRPIPIFCCFVNPEELDFGSEVGAGGDDGADDGEPDCVGLAIGSPIVDSVPVDVDASVR